MGFNYPTQFRDDACRRMLAGERVEVLAVELHVAAGTLYRWKHEALVDAAERRGSRATSPTSSPGRDGGSTSSRLSSRRWRRQARSLTENRSFAQKARPSRSRLDRLGYPERFACRLVGLGRSTFRYEKTRPPSKLEIRRVLLTDVIAEIHAASRGTYGVRRVRAALLYERGLVVNRKLIRKIMGEAGLAGLPSRKKGRRDLVTATSPRRRQTASGSPT
jgi:transposase-like protein